MDGESAKGVKQIIFLKGTGHKKPPICQAGSAVAFAGSRATGREQFKKSVPPGAVAQCSGQPMDGNTLNPLEGLTAQFWLYT